MVLQILQCIATRSYMYLIDKGRPVCVLVFGLQLYLHGSWNNVRMPGLFQHVRDDKIFRTVAITNENDHMFDRSFYSA